MNERPHNATSGQTTSPNPALPTRLLFLSVAINAILLIGLGILIHRHPAMFGLHRSPAIVSTHTINHEVRVPLFDQLAKLSVSSPTVFFGDSQIEFCEWTELLGVPVLNRGAAGDSIQDLLNRTDAITALHPSKVFIMIGTNDALNGASQADFIRRYRELITRLQQPGMQTIIYLQSIPPVAAEFASRPSSGETSTAINQRISSMNEQIKMLADGKSTVFVDVASGLENNGFLDPQFSVDGIHLTPAAYLVWKSQIAKLVSPRAE